MAFTLTSIAFADGQPIPARYTCDGNNVSPPLEWTDPPQGTRSHVLIVEDPDAPSGTFRHWAVYNIGTGNTLLPEGVGPGVQLERLGYGVNDFGHPRYDGPCPPQGHGVHHHHFRLAVLSVSEIHPPAPVKVAELWAAAKPHMIGEAELIGTYAR